MPPRLHVDLRLSRGATLSLPPGAARHVQVLRLQPGAPLTLFDGRGGEWAATVLHMGRSDVQVQLGEHDPIDRELQVAVTLALGMPANERMDALVEKATELGAAAIQPLVCQRSVLRLSGERAQKKVAHWQAVAVAASEQCGRTRVPRIEPVCGIAEWLARLGADDGAPRVVLSFAGGSPTAALAAASASSPASSPASASAGASAGAFALCLSGPEGGLSPDEEATALRAGFAPVSLGPRVLRADTAPLAWLAHLALSAVSAVSAPPQPPTA